MKKIISILLLLMLGTSYAAEKNVLYFTHEPGKWHKYAPQKEVFIEVAKKAGWNLTVSTGDHDSQILKLRDENLTKGFDAVVYNFCFAGSKDLQAVSNVIAQTRKKGTPAMVIHCTMHSFWGTFKNGKAIGSDYKGKAKADAKLVAEWNKTNAGQPFPVWGDFTGVASTGHGPKVPITVEKYCEHEATKSLAASGYTTTNAELYNNFYVTKDVQPLLKGTQQQLPKKIAKKLAKKQALTKKEKMVKAKISTATVMWVVPQGKSKVLGLSLGHDIGEWKQPEFQSLLIDGVNFLMKK
ncbi:MAG: ThuA domain-containing protein [Lentisphaeraceae bacterium]|nr:ThuA domain-containing protein [Lentisphaeraceae bacterium]